MPSAAVLWGESHLTPFGEKVDEDQRSLIVNSLAACGWSATSIRYHPYTVEAALAASQCDVVLNLAYGYSNAAEGLRELQPEVAARLERLGYSCVGACASNQMIAQDKVATAALLAGMGVRSPRRFGPSDWPVEVALAVRKPRSGARHRDVSLHRATDKPTWPDHDDSRWLLQEYVCGPEYTVAVLEDGQSGKLSVLPPLRIAFTEDEAGLAMMGGHASPWDVVIEPESLHLFEDMSHRIFRALGLRDYARFDFRIDADGAVLLDANSLPGLHPYNGLLPLAAKAGGIEYHTLILKLVGNAHRRIASRLIAETRLA